MTHADERDLSETRDCVRRWTTQVTFLRRAWEDRIDSDWARLVQSSSGTDGEALTSLHYRPPCKHNYKLISQSLRTFVCYKFPSCSFVSNQPAIMQTTALLNKPVVQTRISRPSAIRSFRAPSAPVVARRNVVVRAEVQMHYRRANIIPAHFASFLGVDGLV